MSHQHHHHHHHHHQHSILTMSSSSPLSKVGKSSSSSTTTITSNNHSSTTSTSTSSSSNNRNSSSSSSHNVFQCEFSIDKKLEEFAYLACDITNCASSFLFTVDHSNSNQKRTIRAMCGVEVNSVMQEIALFPVPLIDDNEHSAPNHNETDLEQLYSSFESSSHRTDSTIEVIGDMRAENNEYYRSLTEQFGYRFCVSLRLTMIGAMSCILCIFDYTPRRKLRNTETDALMLLTEKALVRALQLQSPRTANNNNQNNNNNFNNNSNNNSNNNNNNTSVLRNRSRR